MRTLGQERAEYALNEVLENKDKGIDKLKSFSAGAPTVILQNGFGQAMAFWLSKGEDKHKFVFNSIKGWLTKKSFINSANNTGKSEEEFEFVKRLSELEQKEYLAAQKEALLLLEWIKRYTSAFCEDSKNKEVENA